MVNANYKTNPCVTIPAYIYIYTVQIVSTPVNIWNYT